LQQLHENGWAWLLAKTDGDSICAAYELAWVTNASHGYVRPTPTIYEIRAAHLRLCAALGLTMPELHVVRNHLSRVGLDVV
jgi:hypothetical protein